MLYNEWDNFILSGEKHPGRTEHVALNSADSLMENSD